ncbi:MAG: NAD(P)/FAD-dependent oxidoreductase [Planctomycetota bacterium]
MSHSMGNRKPRVVIVGGGFAGIECAKALRKADADVIIIDKQNHFLFQPLLYQVATASLSHSEISHPIRKAVQRCPNASVAMAEVTGIDLANNAVLVEGEPAPFDYLVIAAGVTHAYFGNDEWAPLAPGLKTLDDASELRRRMLLAFESAEHEADEPSRRAALTFAIVGGGPTGVELSGAIKEVAAHTIARDYKHIDTRTTRVVLIEGADRLLTSFPEDLSERAKRDLEKMGVEVRLNAYAEDVTEAGVRLSGGEFIEARNVFWAAGVEAAGVASSIDEVEHDGAGRLVVGPDLSLPGHPRVFAAGDVAKMVCAKSGKEVPGVAQGAMQSGKHIGETIARLVAGERDARRPFAYKDKGQMAVIGRSKAVAELGPIRSGGFLAWLIWSVIPVAFLVGYRNRAKVMITWFWNWLVNSRDALIIMGSERMRVTSPNIPKFDGVVTEAPKRTAAEV